MDVEDILVVLLSQVPRVLDAPDRAIVLTPRAVCASLFPRLMLSHLAGDAGAASVEALVESAWPDVVKALMQRLGCRSVPLARRVTIPLAPTSSDPVRGEATLIVTADLQVVVSAALGRPSCLPRRGHGTP